MDFSSEDTIKQIRLKKKEAEAVGDFEKAARLRDEERQLSERIGRTLEGDSEAPRLSRANLAALIFVCLVFSFHLYQLFVNKVMWGNEGSPIHVASDDILFWIYAAVLAIPVVFIIGILILRFNRFSTIKKEKSKE